MAYSFSTENSGKILEEIEKKTFPEHRKLFKFS